MFTARAMPASQYHSAFATSIRKVISWLFRRPVLTLSLLRIFGARAQIVSNGHSRHIALQSTALVVSRILTPCLINFAPPSPCNANLSEDELIAHFLRRKVRLQLMRRVGEPVRYPISRYLARHFRILLITTNSSIPSPWPEDGGVLGFGSRRAAGGVESK
jgi:hypothetical protein